METCAFTLARCCVLLPALALFGSACFSLYATSNGQGGALLRVGLPALAGVGALAWIVLIGRQMTGAAGLPSPSILWRLCIGTGFGRALGAAALLSLGLAALALRGDGAIGVRVAISAALLVCLAFVGHAAAAPGARGRISEGVMAVHLLATGVWLGGLAPLMRALRGAGPDGAQLLRRFGSIALVCVCAILATGVGSGLVLLAMTGKRLGPSYLAVLSVKLGLVAGLLALAAVNRFRLTPLMAQDSTRAGTALRRTILMEQVLGLGVIAAVGLLGQLDPSA
jgi:putative copper export protein